MTGWIKSNDLRQWFLKTKVSWLILFAVLLFLYSSNKILGSWIVDDAGISLSYAINLAQTGELVSQTGADRVEGYSNPLWVFLLSILSFFFKDLFLLKGLGIFFLMMSLFRLLNASADNKTFYLPYILTTVFVAMQPSVVIWSLSGLENSLYLWGGVELLIRANKIADNTATKTDSIIAGFAVSVLALTRPEGIVFITFYPLIVFVFHNDKISRKTHVFYSVLPGIISFSIYLIFRFFYFSAFFPNTYLAKGGPNLSRLLDVLMFSPHTVQKIKEISGFIFSIHIQTVGILLIITIPVCIFVFKRFKLFIPVTVFFLFTLFVFLIMPDDWMPEGRFATLLFPSGYFLIAGFFQQTLSRKGLFLLSMILAVLFSVNSFGRIKTFADRPPIPLSEVIERSLIFEKWSMKMGIERTSVCMADAGGVLLRNKLELIDLGMLCDRIIAESLGEGSQNRNLNRFQNYILNEKQPDFISIRAYHSWIASFESNPEFRLKYVPIREYYDAWILQRYGLYVFSGDYLKRDLAENNPKAYLEMRKEASILKIYPFVIESQN